MNFIDVNIYNSFVVLSLGIYKDYGFDMAIMVQKQGAPYWSFDFPILYVE